MATPRVRKDELKRLQKEQMEKNRITMEWLMRESATVEEDFIILADGIKVRWHTEKWPQSFEVVNKEDVYFYRTLDDVRLGVRDIRRNNQERYL